MEAFCRVCGLWSIDNPCPSCGREKDTAVGVPMADPGSRLSVNDLPAYISHKMEGLDELTEAINRLAKALEDKDG